MKQQYKKIPNSWKSIRRYDQPTKTLSPKAIDILAVAMYQANKYNQAILTHRVLKEITDRKKRQNRNLVNELGFIFNLEFSRCLFEGKKKYNDAYKLTFTKNAAEILENPEDYFAEFEDEIPAKDRSKKITTSQQNDKKDEAIDGAMNIETSGNFTSSESKDRAINCATSGNKLPDMRQKITPSQELLHIYIKKLIYITNRKTNVDVDIDLYMLIKSMNWNSLFSQNTPEQIDEFSQFIAKKSPFYFYNKDDSPAAYRDLHEIDTMDKLRTRYLTEFQKIGMAEAKREYEENMKRFKC